MEEKSRKSSRLVNIQRPEVIWHQVGDQIRAKILSGELPPGAKLPSTASIAKEAETDVKTVHRALSVLVKEGLISRRRKIGTIVTERKSTISPVGVYSHIGFPAATNQAFLHHLLIRVQQEARRLKLQTVTWNDERSDEESKTMMPEIERAVRTGQINSLIVINFNPKRYEALNKLHVPCAFYGGYKSNCVNFQHSEFVRLALESLKARGCRSVGFINQLDPDVADDSFLQMCKSLGLKTREDFVIHNIEFGENDLERFGYEGFKQLWSRKPRHPDGIIVYPDTSARGAIIAAAESGAKIGKDLHLALHRNEGIDIFCPFPADWILTDIQETARALIKQVKNVLAGRSREPMFVEFRREDGTH